MWPNAEGPAKAPGSKPTTVARSSTVPSARGPGTRLTRPDRDSYPTNRLARLRRLWWIRRPVQAATPTSPSKRRVASTASTTLPRRPRGSRTRWLRSSPSSCFSASWAAAPSTSSANAPLASGRSWTPRRNRSCSRRSSPTTWRPTAWRSRTSRRSSTSSVARTRTSRWSRSAPTAPATRSRNRTRRPSPATPSRWPAS